MGGCFGRDKAWCSGFFHKRMSTPKDFLQFKMNFALKNYPLVNDHIAGWKESPFSIGKSSTQSIRGQKFFQPSSCSWIPECTYGCFQKKGYPKMDGENNGKPYYNGMIWGGKNRPLFLVQHLYECWGFNQANQSPQKVSTLNGKRFFFNFKPPALAGDQ